MLASHGARFALATLLATGAGAPVAEAATAVFPIVSGSNLNGKAFTLPGDFVAPASIVYIAYARGQQAQVDSWNAPVADLRRRYPVLGAYEVPTLSKSNAFFRGFIDGGMRNGIPDPAVRAVTITLYIDKRAFNAALDITSESDITVLLVKPDGTVLWRATGAYDPSKTAGLEAAAAAVTKG